MSLLAVANLTVTYRRDGRNVVALANVSVDVAEGERLAVIGESGSGKSTLALAMAGLLPREAHASGRIVWPGLGARPIAGKDIGFVFQDPSASLDPVLTIGEQIAEVAHAHLGLGWKQSFLHAQGLLERVRLPDPPSLLKAFPHQLSGGQKQRVAIAAAIAAKPKLLIADEATSALDTIVQAEIVALIGEIAAAEAMSLVFITHDIALASGFADRIAVLRGGRQVETGPALDVVTAPRDPYVRMLIGSYAETPWRRQIAAGADT